ncbi:MAG: hypothetical protein M0Z65_06660 [Firmicutes bacterium]|uniref:Uncharacterized protein n=1 Tax=Melghirimyces thermohalophilus TaxID=1236220 RepID=A0A1G6KST4_9BACL|nr:hypothetical protein [Melghirimyces thermohalophilus]MDA8352861.1 hypothetical protein [Bacillota bacterium]SDC33436.1 hypothetical protein SAMN04488112_106114 [Melghirimyces thermohalophilus]
MDRLCLPNIGPKGRRWRYWATGINFVMVAFTLIASASADWGFWTNLTLAVPIWLGFLGFFQAREKTCVFLAARGLRSVDDRSLPFMSETEQIEDKQERAQIKRQANRVHLRTLGATCVLMTIVITITIL